MTATRAARVTSAAVAAARTAAACSLKTAAFARAASTFPRAVALARAWARACHPDLASSIDQSWSTFATKSTSAAAATASRSASVSAAAIHPQSMQSTTDSGSTIDSVCGAKECNDGDAEGAVGEEPKSRVRVGGLWDTLSILDTDLTDGGGVSGGLRRLD